MFYFEQRTQVGRWSPTTAPERPRLHKSGRLLKGEGIGPLVRGVKRVDEAHRELPLDRLRVIYGVLPPPSTKSGASGKPVSLKPGAPVEDAEVVGEPVFRSGRAAG